MAGIKKKLLGLFLLLAACSSMVMAQKDSTLPQPPDTTQTASPAGPDKFDLDTNNKPPLDSVFIIKEINIIGNKITRKNIILRELPFKEGDSVHIRDLPSLFARGKSQVLGLSLFSTSDRDFSISVDGYDGIYMNIKIAVKERWYLLPAPYLKPVDRSLSEWLFQNRAQISRLDYGVKAIHSNVTGNNDKLRVQFVTGYTKQLGFSYSRPYIDKNMKWGVNVGFQVGKTHEINIATHPDSNRLVFLNDRDRYLRNFSKGNLDISYRPKLYTLHVFGIGYQSLKVADTVLIANPDYLKFGQTQIQFPEIYYRLVYQKLNLRQYPTKGYAAELFLLKQGLNSKINVWQLSAKGIGYWPTKIPRTFYSVAVLGSVKLPLRQPYYTSQLLGYGDFTMGGYEYYVIDGTAGGLVKATFAKQIANFSFAPPILKKRLASLIPFKIYGKVFGNAGYAYNEQPWASRLNNRMLYGIGAGFDIFTDYDFTLRLEFSVNHLGQGRFYSEKKTIF